MNTLTILRRNMTVEPGETAGSFRAAFTPPADFPPFAGHFPGKPVLPGIAQTLIVTEALRKFSGQHAELAEIRRIKFTNPAFPEVQLFIQADCRPAKDGLEVSAAISGNGKKIATLKLLFRGVTL